MLEVMSSSSSLWIDSSLVSRTRLDEPLISSALLVRISVVFQ